MTEFRDIQTIHVVFTNRDGVPTALTIDGTVPEADLRAGVIVDDDGMTAAIEVEGVVPNGIGYTFWSAEDWELVKRRRGAGYAGRSRPEPKPLGRVGQIILTCVALAIVCPFIAILWAWAGGIYRSLS